jgi:hypothetical protein
MRVVVATLLVMMVSPCLAVDAPALPPAAKKLNAKEIAALYARL